MRNIKGAVDTSASWFMLIALALLLGITSDVRAQCGGAKAQQGSSSTSAQGMCSMGNAAGGGSMTSMMGNAGSGGMAGMMGNAAGGGMMSMCPMMGGGGPFGPKQVGFDIVDAAALREFDISESRPELCEDACAKDSDCKSYTYTSPGTYNNPKAKCWLKKTAGRFVAHEGAVSAVKR